MSDFDHYIPIFWVFTKLTLTRIVLTGKTQKSGEVLGSIRLWLEES